MLHITHNIDTYTQHATHYTEHGYLHTICYTLHRTLILTHNMLYITQNIDTYTQHATHYTKHCYKHYPIQWYTLTQNMLHITQNIVKSIVQWYDAHCTEHWYWCTLHRTLVQIAQNIDAHCIEHLHTFHRTFAHIAQHIYTHCSEHWYNCTENIIFWTLCITLHFTHTQTTRTRNISWDISLTHSKVSLWCAVKYTNTYPSIELLISQVFIITSWCITNDGRRRGADARRWLYLFPYPLWAPV